MRSSSHPSCTTPRCATLRFRGRRLRRRMARIRTYPAPSRVPLANRPVKRILGHALTRESAMTHTALAPATPARQVAGFLARFDPKIAHIARHARMALRRRLPTALELVYDNFHALVMGFGSSDRASDCIVSLAVYPNGVSLNF